MIPMSKRRHKIVKAMVREMSLDCVLAAAGQLMADQADLEEAEYTTDEVCDWIERLNAKGLIRLRRMAESLEVTMEPGPLLN
jgi:hypothetical protein